MTSHTLPTLHRRNLLGLALGALIAAVPWRPGMADTTANATPQAPVARLDNALLAAMKAGSSVSFQQRYRMLEPVIEQTFNLRTILAESVGLAWATMPAAQKATLAAAFRRYTVSSYVSNFDSYNGQSFRILPIVRQISSGEGIVATLLLRQNKSPVKLNYVVRQGPAGWQVVDVLTDGSISRVAVQRSDFEQLLLSGGVPSLTVALNHKVSNLSGGMVS